MMAVRFLQCEVCIGPPLILCSGLVWVVCLSGGPQQGGALVVKRAGEGEREGQGGGAKRDWEVERMKRQAMYSKAKPVIYAPNSHRKRPRAPPSREYRATPV
jgi:hypothetical protein